MVKQIEKKTALIRLFVEKYYITNMKYHASHPQLVLYEMLKVEHHV